MEIDKISDRDKKANVLHLAKIIRETIIYSPEIRHRAMELEKLNTIRRMDSLHIASAESGHADVFLSTDDKLLKACRRMQDKLKVKVKTPYFIWQR